MRQRIAYRCDQCGKIFTVRKLPMWSVTSEIYDTAECPRVWDVQNECYGEGQRITEENRHD